MTDSDRRSARKGSQDASSFTNGLLPGALISSLEADSSSILYITVRIEVIADQSFWAFAIYYATVAISL